MSKPPRRFAPHRLESGHVIDGHLDLYVDGTFENIDDVIRGLRATIDELGKGMAQLLIDNTRLARGRKRGGRAPDMASEAFSALASVLLRRGVPEPQLLEDLSEAYRAYGVPNRAKRAEETLALAKQRLAE